MNICLDSVILVVDKNSEAVVDTVLCSFEDGRNMLTKWREIWKCQYPGDPELWSQIPEEWNLPNIKLTK